MTRVARVVEGRDKQFQHLFGGRIPYSGITPTGCKLPLHLLYRFDTDDPAFPLKIPGVRFLPLFFPFQYDGGACGYRVKSDTEIEILYLQNKRIVKDFPYEDYPSEFDERHVRLEPITYEQHKVIAFLLEGGEKALSKKDHKLLFTDLRYPFSQLGGIHELKQGFPDVACPEPTCENSRCSDFMEVFAVVWHEPHPGVFLWDSSADDVQLIFLICPTCHALHACNRCS
jgi:hypothetical protein